MPRSVIGASSAQVTYASGGTGPTAAEITCACRPVSKGMRPLPAPTSLMRREAQERVRRLGEIWTGPATEVTFAWAHMIGSMRARRSRERPRNEGGHGEGLGCRYLGSQPFPSPPHKIFSRGGDGKGKGYRMALPRDYRNRGRHKRFLSLEAKEGLTSR